MNCETSCVGNKKKTRMNLLQTLLIAILGVFFLLYISTSEEIAAGSNSDVIYYLWLGANVSVYRILIFSWGIIPFTISCFEDYTKNCTLIKIEKIGILRYCTRKAMMSVITTMITVILGFALYIIYLRTRFPIFNGDANRCPAFSQLLIDNKPCQYAMATIWNISLFSAVWAMVANCVSTIIPNKCYITAIPVMGYYLINEISNMLRLPNRLHIVSIGWGQVYYDNPYNAIVGNTLFFVICITIITCLFIIGVKKRVSDVERWDNA